MSELEDLRQKVRESYFEEFPVIFTKDDICTILFYMEERNIYNAREAIIDAVTRQIAED